MRPCTAQLAAYLVASDAVAVTDLYTFALATGEVLRYSGWTTALQIPGTLFPADSLNYNARTITPRSRSGRALAAQRSRLGSASRRPSSTSTSSPGPVTGSVAS